jgi:hypothetical protein
MATTVVEAEGDGRGLVVLAGKILVAAHLLHEI